MEKHLEERAAKTPTLNGNILEGMVAPYYDGTPGTQYDLYKDGTTFERFQKGCFDDFLKSGQTVRAYANHNPGQVLGATPRTLQLDNRNDGLYYRIDLPDTTVGRDTKVLVDRGDVQGASVSMYNLQVRWSKEGNANIRTIVKANLDHVAPCRITSVPENKCYHAGQL